MNRYPLALRKNLLLFFLGCALTPKLTAERAAGNANNTSRKITLELKEITFGNPAAEKTGNAGQLAEKLAKAMEVSSGKSRVYRIVAKSDKPGKFPPTHSLTLRFQLYDNNWVLTYQVITNKTMKVIKQDLIEFENPANPDSIAEMLVPVIETVLKP